MKLIYVASPYAGDIQKNTEFAKKACRHVMNEGHAFFAPHLLYPQLLDDAKPQEREKGIAMGIAMIHRCDELWCYGECISQGMAQEIDIANKIGIPIQFISLPRIAYNEKKKELTNFSPSNYEIESKCYGNTGGHCMVATVKFYLPDLDKNVWINCNDESFSITAEDYIWNDDHSESWEHYEEVLLFSADFCDDIPVSIAPWIPPIKETLEYTIEQELLESPHKTITIPLSLLPDSILLQADPDYINWLQSEGKDTCILQGGKIQVDEQYRQSNVKEHYAEMLRMS